MYIYMYMYLHMYMYLYICTYICHIFCHPPFDVSMQKRRLGLSLHIDLVAVALRSVGLAVTWRYFFRKPMGFYRRFPFQWGFP